jgi:hypothetical protein
MAAVKVSVAIDETDLAWARKRAKREKASLSAVVSEALADQRRMEARRAFSREMAKHGPPVTREEIEAVVAEWGDFDERSDARHGSSDRIGAVKPRRRVAARTSRLGRRDRP